VAVDPVFGELVSLPFPVYQGKNRDGSSFLILLAPEIDEM
jgi:hypothetical protein